MSRIADCLRAYCTVAMEGVEGGSPEQQEALRRELQPLLQMDWPLDGDGVVREFFAVPNHCFACTDLDYHRFSTLPLVLGPHTVHIYHIMEAFSRTNPTRYAAVWMPLLDLMDAATEPDPGLRLGLDRARAHLRQQLQTAVVGTENAGGTTTTPSLDAQLDGVMNNLMQSFPGLHSMVQQIMATADAGAPDAGLGGVFGQIQGILTPLLTQAAASATAQDPTLTPAIGQILAGFTALTQALAPPGPPGPPGPPTSSTHEHEAPMAE